MEHAKLVADAAEDGISENPQHMMKVAHRQTVLPGAHAQICHRVLLHAPLHNISRTNSHNDCVLLVFAVYCT